MIPTHRVLEHRIRLLKALHLARPDQTLIANRVHFISELPDESLDGHRHLRRVEGDSVNVVGPQQVDCTIGVTEDLGGTANP